MLHVCYHLAMAVSDFSTKAAVVVRADLAPIEHADRVGRRNGWLQVTVAVAALLLAAAARRLR